MNPDRIIKNPAQFHLMDNALIEEDRRYEQSQKRAGETITENPVIKNSDEKDRALVGRGELHANITKEIEELERLIREQ